MSQPETMEIYFCSNPLIRLILDEVNRGLPNLERGKTYTIAIGINSTIPPEQTTIDNLPMVIDFTTPNLNGTLSIAYRAGQKYNVNPLIVITTGLEYVTEPLGEWVDAPGWHNIHMELTIVIPFEIPIGEEIISYQTATPEQSALITESNLPASFQIVEAQAPIENFIPIAVAIGGLALLFFLGG